MLIHHCSIFCYQQQQHEQKSENREIMTETITKIQVFEEKQRQDRKSLIVHHPKDDSEKGIYETKNREIKSLFFKHHVEPDAEAIAQMKEIIYTTAAFRPANHSIVG
ncbi:LOW QUALITY PROTEIN: hypothetical protein HID58_080058, partial [Brassica napus]